MKSQKKSTTSSSPIVRRALRVPQPGGRDMFLFTMSSKELLELAEISRIHRGEEGKLLGYQRPEVRRHVNEIADYLDSDDMIFAHPLILALSSDFKFVSSRGQNTNDGLATSGTLQITNESTNPRKPAWIVDGQQRALAISRCKRNDFAIPICAFIADEIEVQRDQFLRINNSRPLPRGLITELLPEITSSLPPKLAVRRIPAAVCDLLNRDPKSPFFELIQRASTPQEKKKQAVVTDTVVIKMIEDSLTHTSGCLFPFRNVATGECDNDGIFEAVTIYWTAVKETFPEAWGLSSTKSRLMHGVGIRSMGKLMDRIMSQIDHRDAEAKSKVIVELKKISSLCRWTSGQWEDLEDLQWNAFQNVPKHISLLSNFLIRSYLNHR